MSVNDTIDPRFLYHVEDESLRFRVGESGHKNRELDRRFEISSFRGNEKDETRYCEEEEDVCLRRRGSLIQPGVDSCSSVRAETNTESKDPPGSCGWELVVRDEEEEEKSCTDRCKVIITNDSSQCNTQGKRDYASVEKERVNSVCSWESLKSILSDPVTGTLMSDATILPCGHSFGAGGLKEVKRMKACFTCSQPTCEGSEKPNLSLRIVVHAFRQEEESDHVHSLKRKKERSDQQKRTFCIQKITDTPKSSSRGIQFPFSIGDRIIIEVCDPSSTIPKITLTQHRTYYFHVLSNELSCGLGKQKDTSTVCGTQGCDNDTLLKWMVCCEDNGQCRVYQVATLLTCQASIRQSTF